MAGYTDVYDDIYEADTGLEQSLTGSLFISGATFFVGGLVEEGILGGVLFESAPTFFVGSLVYDQTLGGVLFQSTPFFPTGQIRNPLGGRRPFKVIVTNRPTRRLALSD